MCAKLHTHTFVGLCKRQLWKLLNRSALIPGLTCIVDVMFGTALLCNLGQIDFSECKLNRRWNY